MFVYEVSFGGDSMPLNKGKSRGHQLMGLTTAKVRYGDIHTTAVDVDLTSVAGTDSQLTSSKAVKDYIDTTNTIASSTDTTIASVGDNNNLQYDGTSSKWVNRSYIDFAKIAAPADPSSEEGRLYVKELNGTNNALAVKIQKAGNVVEVELTSPGCVCECGSTDGAKDPIYNFAEGIMIIELYCGHSYSMDIPNLRRIQ